jgi:hypothetical protein
VRTVEEVTRGVLAALNSSAGLLLSAKWVSDRYVRIAARVRLRHLREIGEIIVPAEIKAGTATFTRGSKVVTGDATARAAWTPDITGRSIRAKTTWYEIAGVTIDGEMRLKSSYSEDTVTAGAYKIVQRFSPIDERARWIGDVIVSMRTRRPVERTTLDALDLIEPSRPYVGGLTAEVWADVGRRLVGEKLRRVIELYPYSTAEELYHYVLYPEAPELQYDDEIPSEVDPHVLHEGALIDAMRYEMARSAQAGNVEAAALWRNEYRAQEVRWEKIILDTFRADAASDDATFILESGRPRVGNDIVTARDEIIARAARP